MKNNNSKTFSILNLLNDGGFRTYTEICVLTGSSRPLIRLIKSYGFIEIVGTVGKTRENVVCLSPLGKQYIESNYGHKVVGQEINKGKFKRLREMITKCYHNLVKMQ